VVDRLPIKVNQPVVVNPRALEESKRSMIDSRFVERVEQIHRQLCIPEDYAARTSLSLHAEPAELVLTEPDYYGREQRLTPAALAAWHAMKSSAQAEGVTLHLISGFRSVDYQCLLIRRKLDAGQSMEQILRVNAAPGYSEHHSGCAIDIGTLDCAALEEEFELTPAFAWLLARADDFGFQLSFPRGNPCGIAYEPWHWRYRGG